MASAYSTSRVPRKWPGSLKFAQHLPPTKHTLPLAHTRTHARMHARTHAHTHAHTHGAPKSPRDGSRRAKTEARRYERQVSTPAPRGPSSSIVRICPTFPPCNNCARIWSAETQVRSYSRARRYTHAWACVRTHTHEESARVSRRDCSRLPHAHRALWAPTPVPEKEARARV